MRWEQLAVDPGEPTVVRGPLGSGSVAFVDAADRTAHRWWGRVIDAAASEATRQAARDVVATARAALDRVADVPARRVAVLGDGMLALLVRRELGEGSPIDGSDKPIAVVDAAGTPSALMVATSCVGSGGRVVLAAPPEEACVELRTYSDVHVRGLTFVGLPWSEATPSGAVPEPDVEWVLSRLAGAVVDRPTARAAWYRVVHR